MKFDADKSGIGKTGTTFQPKVEGENAYWDFYDPDEWERQQIGVFSPEYDNRLSDEQRVAYKEHMRIQMAAAKEWRKAVLGEDERIVMMRRVVTVCLQNTLPTFLRLLRLQRTRYQL